jgi:pepF/M3 family oligoendopeptidase
MATDALPRWDLRNVYPHLSSPELEADFTALSSILAEIERHHSENLSRASGTTQPRALATALDRAVDLFNRAYLLSATLEIYIDSFVATDSYDTAAAKKLSELEIAQVRLKQGWTRFQGWIHTMAEALPGALRLAGSAREHAFILREAAAQGAYLMSGPEEMLSAELSLAGANAWGKLQRTITSQINVDFDVDGTPRKLPMPALINLRSHPEEPVRRRAYEAEIREWEKVREPLAACMNGVKGAAVTLQRRRGRTDCLHAPIDLARIDRPTLQTLLDAMKDSLPHFRRYFRAKAARLGKEKLAWWDLFAPAGGAGSTFGWRRARDFILENFAAFSPDLRTFAERAFDGNWIDAEPRDGKRGGAFCSAVPRVKESRILCNFDGSLEQVSTVAHELGHGFHNDCAYRAGKTELQQVTPMTLAETASIMCESIVTNAVLAGAHDAAAELAVLENALINDSQVIVDIYSRFIFEKEVMERRERSELSPDDLCGIMEKAQGEAYGDGLDERYRHRYMWTWKPHYYFADLNFYNFPYAFGLLFGTGLYAVYKRRGAGFVAEYQELLASTGEGTAADLAGRFGIDIRSRAFWDDSVGIIRERIDRYCAL